MRGRIRTPIEQQEKYEARAAKQTKRRAIACVCMCEKEATRHRNDDVAGCARADVPCAHHRYRNRYRSLPSLCMVHI